MYVYIKRKNEEIERARRSGKKIASRIYIIRSRLNERGRETETPSKFPLRSLPPPTVFHGGGIPLLFPLPSTSSPSPSPPLGEGRPKINVDHLYREHTLFDSLRDPRLLEWLIGTTTMDIFYTAARGTGGRVWNTFIAVARDTIESCRTRRGPTPPLFLISRRKLISLLAFLAPSLPLFRSLISLKHPPLPPAFDRGGLRGTGDS